MLDPGVYRLFHISMNNSQPSERFAGRFMINGKEFHVLEDPHNLMEDSLSMGGMTHEHVKMLHNLLHSGYFKIVNEEHINQGHHGHLVPEMDIGPTTPDEEYILHGDALNVPKKVEIYGSNMCVDGERLSPEELEQLMSQIRNGLLTLTPV